MERTNVYAMNGLLEKIVQVSLYRSGPKNIKILARKKKKGQRKYLKSMFIAYSRVSAPLQCI